MEPVVQRVVVDRPIAESTYKHQVKFLGITVNTTPTVTAWDPPHHTEFDKQNESRWHYDQR
jgi:hypothetical protein